MISVQLKIKVAHFAVVIALTWSPETFAAKKNLLFLDNSVTNDTYIPSNKETQIDTAFQLGIAKLKTLFPKCDLNAVNMIERGALNNVVNQVKDIKSKYKPAETVVVGLIHSSEALLAAKSFKGSEFVLLSSGATSENIRQMNDHLFSLANPITGFVAKVVTFLESKNMKSVSILAPGNSSYAIEFATNLKSTLDRHHISSSTTTVDSSDLETSLAPKIAETLKADAVFVPGFIQQSLPIVAYLQKKNFSGLILGSPNWGRSLPDLITLMSRLNLKTDKMFFPVSWLAGETQASKTFEHSIETKLKSETMGTTAYTYDATLLGGMYLCSNSHVSASSFAEFLNKKKKLTSSEIIRVYRGFKDNHLESNIEVVGFQGQKLRKLP